MNVDIRIAVDFWHHPKTKKLIRRLGLEGARSLQILWTWTAANRPSGVLSGMDEEDIELAADWQGDVGAFISALKEMHWIDKTSEGYALHEWIEHNPWVADDENRSNKARLAKLQQVNSAAYNKCVKEGKTGLTKSEYETLKLYCANDEHLNSECTANAERTQSDGKTNAERNASETPAPSPSPNPSLIKDNTPLTPQRGDEVRGKKETIADILKEQPQELAEPLMEFVRHRRNLKKPLTPHALRLQISNLQKLASGNLDRQKFLIEHAIMNGWQGIYEPKDDVSHVPRPTTVAQQRQQERQVMAQMLLADGDRKRAEEKRDAHGNRIVTNADGTQLTLPPGW